MDKERLENYRHQEVELVLSWVQAQESGVVAGMPGCGRSTFLKYLAQQSTAIKQILTDDQTRYCFVAVDLHDLPDYRLATLYRVILRSFYEARPYFDSLGWSERLAETYQKIEGERDAFVVQSALRRLLIECETENVQVVLIFNRFDRFLDKATLQMTLTLRALRDSFKNTLTYILGIGQPLAYLKHYDALHPLLHFTDTQICWVKPLDYDHSRSMMRRQYRYEPKLDGDEEQVVFQLSGGNPMLIRVLCNEWPSLRAVSMEDSLQLVVERAIGLAPVEDRLRRLWTSFSSAEQAMLAQICRHKVLLENVGEGEIESFRLLLDKGICVADEGELVVVGALFQRYVLERNPSKLGRIRYDGHKNEFYRGEKQLSDLSRSHEKLLRHLLSQAGRRVDRVDLEIELWPEDSEFVEPRTMANRLQKLVSELRHVIEPQPSHPIYLITRRGRPSSYQFFPDGRPQNELDY